MKIIIAIIVIVALWGCSKDSNPVSPETQPQKILKSRLVYKVDTAHKHFDTLSGAWMDSLIFTAGYYFDSKGSPVSTIGDTAECLGLIFTFDGDSVFTEFMPDYCFLNGAFSKIGSARLNVHMTRNKITTEAWDSIPCDKAACYYGARTDSILSGGFCGKWVYLESWSVDNYFVYDSYNNLIHSSGYLIKNTYW